MAPNLLGDPSFTLTGGNLLIEMFFSFSLVLTVLQTTVRVNLLSVVGRWGDTSLTNQLTNRTYLPITSQVSKVQSRRGVAAPAIAALVGLGAALGAKCVLRVFARGWVHG